MRRRRQGDGDGRRRPRWAKEWSNNYGEFVVDKLEPGTEYEVVIEAAGYKPYSGKAKLDKSLNLGLILLEKA